MNQSCSVVNAKPITFRYSNENRSMTKTIPYLWPKWPKLAKIDTPFMTETTEKPYPSGPHILDSPYNGVTPRGLDVRGADHGPFRTPNDRISRMLLKVVWSAFNAMKVNFRLSFKDSICSLILGELECSRNYWGFFVHFPKTLLRSYRLSELDNSWPFLGTSIMTFLTGNLKTTDIKFLISRKFEATILLWKSKGVKVLPNGYIIYRNDPLGALNHFASALALRSPANLTAPSLDNL